MVGHGPEREGLEDLKEKLIKGSQWLCDQGREAERRCRV